MTSLGTHHPSHAPLVLGGIWTTVALHLAVGPLASHAQGLHLPICEIG